MKKEIKRDEISLSMLDNFLPAFLTLYCSQSLFKKTKVIIVPHDGLPRRSVALSSYVTKLGGKTSIMTINVPNWARIGPWCVLEGQLHTRVESGLSRHVFVIDSFSWIFLDRGANRGAQTRHRQIYADWDYFLSSAAISISRTFVMLIFLKSRKLVSIFLVIAVISSNFGLNVPNFG